jgi:anaerobic selenocysteine-containing dehydrogenase
MSSNILDRRLTRRQFVKTAAAVAAVAAGSGKLWGGRQLLVEASTPGAPATAQDEWLKSWCRMCQNPVCSTLVHVKEGVVVAIEGDPQSPLNQGTLCPRGQGAVFNLYNPYRVKAPMKRTNPNKDLNEDPKWVEITWDEALNSVAQQLQKTAAKDPRAIVFTTGFGSASDYHGAIISGLIAAIGIPSANQVPTNGPLCSTHIAVRMTQGGAHTNGPDYNYCNYLITMGSSMGANWATSGGPVRGVMNAIERGMKSVVVDPRMGKEASMSEWVPIRPGSELAFELALLNVMLYEIGLAKLDVTFLKRRSNAPYLVGAGERFYRDPATKKPMLWDLTDNKAKVFDDPSIKDYALEGEFQVGGQTVQPGFALVKAGMKSYTPEWSEPLTTIPATTIRRIANEFVAAAQVGSTIQLDGVDFPLRPAMIWPKRGALCQLDGAYVHFASKLINELVGAMDVPGGDTGNIYGANLKPNEDGLVAPTTEAVGTAWKFPPDDVQLSPFFPFRHTDPFIAWRAIIDPKKYYLPYQVDMIVNFGGNAIVNNAAPDEPLAAYKKVSFVASVAYHFDEPTMLADVVLPESSNLEREMFRAVPPDSKGRFDRLGTEGVIYRYPVVQNLYDTKMADEIFLDLSRRLNMQNGKQGLLARLNTALGLKPEFALDTETTYAVHEIIDRELKSQFGADKGADFFKTVGFKFESVGPAKVYAYAGYPMGKTRYHFFMEHVKEVGDRLKDGIQKAGISFPGWDLAEVMEHYHAVPVWRQMPIHKQSSEYDLFFTNWKTPFVLFGLGGNVENPWFYEISKETDPYQKVILMNPATAAKKGLKEGDLIEVTSRSGMLTGRLKLSSLFHPEVIGTPGNFGRRSIQMNPIATEGINFNQLISPDDGWFDPINTAIAISPRVKVRKV